MRLSQRGLHGENQCGFGDFIWLTRLIKGFLFSWGSKSAIYSQNSQTLLTKTVSISTFERIDDYYCYYFFKSNLLNELINLTLLYHKASTVTQPAAIWDPTRLLHVFSSNYNGENYLPVNSTDKAATVSDPTSWIKVLNYPLKTHLLPSLSYTPAVSRTPFKQVFPPSSPWTVWSGYPASASRFV